MRKIIILLIGALLVTQLLFAQDSATAKTKTYNIVLRSNTLKKPSVSYLAYVSDTVIYTSHRPVKLKREEPLDAKMRKFNYADITKVNVRRRGSVLRNALVGSVVGIAVGAIAGHAKGDDPPCQHVTDPNNPLTIILFGPVIDAVCDATRRTAAQKATTGAILGGVGGAMAGAIVGALVHKTFKIEGRTDRLREMKAKLLP